MNLGQDRLNAIPEIQPIGVIRTPFQRASGTPIQGSLTPEAEGRVQIFPEFEPGLKDLAGFDRIWLLYFFDRACEARLIVRPYLSDTDCGVFATRSPARPNHIGMSAVRLLGIEGRTLRVSCVDILDGTPLLDIKPYVPEFDHFTVERVGWYQGRSAAGIIADGRFEKP